jgi:hypothetical protein
MGKSKVHLPCIHSSPEPWLVACAGLQKFGGQPLSTTAQLQDCIAHARLRHREVSHILQKQLDAGAA